MRDSLGRWYQWALVLVLVGCGNSTRNGTAPSTQTSTGASGPVTSATTTAVGSSDAGTSSAAGGTATSAATTSGAAGNGGSAGDASGGATASGGASGGAAPEEAQTCRDDSDCILVDDCCSCRAVSAESHVDDCAIDCDVNRCSETGHAPPSAVCRAGRCRLDVDCDPSEVTCRIAVPECAPGELPEVVDACYTGRCFEAKQCNRVASCGDCAEGEACVHWQTQLFSFHCVAPVAGCALDDCECMQACDGISCAEGTDSDLACFCDSC